MTFEIGTRVRTRARASAGHTRLPAYLQHKAGVVAHLYGSFPLPDDRAAGAREPRREALYAVRFPAREVWGAGSSEGDAIYADLFEFYLESER